MHGQGNIYKNQYPSRRQKISLPFTEANAGNAY